jgi:hypothetical protein
MSNFYPNILHSLLLDFPDLLPEVQTKFLQRLQDILAYYFQEPQYWEIMQEFVKEGFRNGSR